MKATKSILVNGKKWFLESVEKAGKWTIEYQKSLGMTEDVFTFKTKDSVAVKTMFRNATTGEFVSYFDLAGKR